MSCMPRTAWSVVAMVNPLNLSFDHIVRGGRTRSQFVDAARPYSEACDILMDITRMVDQLAVEFHRHAGSVTQQHRERRQAFDVAARTRVQQIVQPPLAVGGVVGAVVVAAGGSAAGDVSVVVAFSSCSGSDGASGKFSSVFSAGASTGAVASAAPRSPLLCRPANNAAALASTSTTITPGSSDETEPKLRRRPNCMTGGGSPRPR